MQLHSVLERIRDKCPTVRLVGGAASFERAVAGLTTWPAVFVVPDAESAEASPFMDQVTQQQVTIRFNVYVAVRNLADDEGEGVIGSLWEVRGALRDALLGWTPDGAGADVEFESGELGAFDNGTLWWKDAFKTLTTYRSANA